METQSAIDLVNQVIYKPGWTFTASDHQPRFEGTINVAVTYTALDSGSSSVPEAWKDGYTVAVPGGARASFPIIVGDLSSDDELYRRLLRMILKIEEHEAREFLRVRPTGWAPFHPHRIDGMKRWGTPDTDLQFGLS